MAAAGSAEPEYRRGRFGPAYWLAGMSRAAEVQSREIRGETSPQAEQEFLDGTTTEEATYVRVGRLSRCVEKDPTDSLYGDARGEFATSVAGVRLFTRDRRKGRFVTYCLQVNNGWNSGPGGPNAPVSGGLFRLPWLIRRNAESVQVVVDQRCILEVLGRPARGNVLWRLDVTGPVRGKLPRRRWNTLEIPEASDNRTVRLGWGLECH